MRVFNRPGASLGETRGRVMVVLIAIIAALAQDPTTVVNDMLANKAAFERCLIDKTVALGAANTEAADTVLRAAGAECLAQETRLRRSYETFVSVAEAERLIQRDRLQAGNAGVAALLRVRDNDVTEDRN